MDELSGVMDWLLRLGPIAIIQLLAFAVAVATGGGWPRNWVRVGVGLLVLLAPVVVASETGHLMLEMIAIGFLSAVVLAYGLTRRGALRLALVGFAVGSFGNVAVTVANGAMPFDDQALPIITASTVAPDGYEAITDSTRLRWLADIIPVPGVGGLASPGDVLLTISMFAGIIAFAHSPDGRGGTGRRRSQRWYVARFNEAAAIGDFEAAHRVSVAALQARPDEVRLRLIRQADAMGAGDYRWVADDSLDALQDRGLSSWSRGRFLDSYADALLMQGDPSTFGSAEKALREAESLLPGDVRLATSRALLALRRGDLDDAEAGARGVLDRPAPGEHPRARMVLLDTLLAIYRIDGQRSSELLDLLEGLYSDPGVLSTARYVCPLAAYYSHAGDHPAAIKTLRDCAAAALGPDEVAAIGYHLAYVLARSAGTTCVPEIDRLLETLPPGYPSVPALAHTTALRHLTAGDHSAALAAACRSLASDTLTPAEAAEVHLTVSTALAALGRHVEAAESRAEASRHAPNHQILDLAHT